MAQGPVGDAQQGCGPPPPTQRGSAVPCSGSDTMISSLNKILGLAGQAEGAQDDVPWPEPHLHRFGGTAIEGASAKAPTGRESGVISERSAAA